MSNTVLPTEADIDKLGHVALRSFISNPPGWTDTKPKSSPASGASLNTVQKLRTQAKAILNKLAPPPPPPQSSQALDSDPAMLLPVFVLRLSPGYSLR